MTARSRVTWLAAAGLVIGCIAFAIVRLVVPAGPLAPDFTLTDQDGKPFTLSAQRGHPVALFFGYAHCPDVCPTTLAALAGAKRKLGAAAGGIDVVLVTVDPQRDSAATLKRYVHLFDPSFTGLTGSERQLDPVYASYHIVHEIDRGGKSANGYSVAHSSIVQFISPQGRLRGTGNFSDSADDMAVLMKASLS